MQIEIAGENALIVYLAATASPGVSSQIQQLSALLEQSLGEDLVDLIPSYASVLVIYDPLRVDHHQVHKSITTAFGQLSDSVEAQGRLVSLPVYYSEESGPDLASLAQRAGLSIKEVVALHSASEYRVYAIGFAPGFAYLGEVDPRIAAPRLQTPRLKVPRGAVAIADRQTAVYPAVSPGGWNLLGLCPVPMFDPDRTPSMPVAVGDKVQFEPISRAEYIKLGGVL